MELYPLTFKPVYIEKIWGGNKLKESFSRDIKSTNIGESWELSVHPNGKSKIANGKLAGEDFLDLIENHPEKIIGEKYNNDFPLLVKFLDVSKKLSVQVHPDDQYTKNLAGESGKTEMWYIVAANDDAEIVYGLKNNTTREEIKESIKKGSLETHLNSVSVNKGDVIYIPSGTIHCIKGGVLIAEIQQSSDLTYRVYDWNRTNSDGESRELHIDKALDVINYEQSLDNIKLAPLVYDDEDYKRYFYAASPYFSLEKIDLSGSYKINPAEKDRFNIIIVLAGEGELNYNGQSYNLFPGKTYFLPISLDEVQVNGDLEFLNTYIANSKDEVYDELESLNFSKEEIESLAGFNEW